MEEINFCQFHKRVELDFPVVKNATRMIGYVLIHRVDQ